jgi:hypothetical protein
MHIAPAQRAIIGYEQLSTSQSSRARVFGIARCISYAVCRLSGSVMPSTPYGAQEIARSPTKP